VEMIKWLGENREKLVGTNMHLCVQKKDLCVQIRVLCRFHKRYFSRGLRMLYCTFWFESMAFSLTIVFG
jgi:hypothetical protein